MRTRTPRANPSASRRHAKRGGAGLAARLTARDLWLLDMLHAHKVLTSTQILRLAFTARRTASIRLSRLAAHRALDTFRPHVSLGSAPLHVTVGPVGAQVLAARRGTTVRDLPWRPDDTDRTAHSAHLAHTVGANEVMVRLAAEHRTRPDRELLLWLPPTVCAHLWGDWIRPDAYGLHHQAAPPHDPPGTRVPDPATDPAPAYPAGTVTGFFLEYDRGTEPAWRVAAKLTGYAAHAAGTRTRTPVLVHTPTPARERLLRTRLAEAAADLDVPVATTHGRLAPAGQPRHLVRFDAGTDPTPADAVWLPLTPGRHHRDRLQLADLPRLFGDLVPALALPDDAADPPDDWHAVPPLPPPGNAP